MSDMENIVALHDTPNAVNPPQIPSRPTSQEVNEGEAISITAVRQITTTPGVGSVISELEEVTLVSVEQLVHSLSQKLQEEAVEINDDNILILMKYAMEIVELQQISGENKKQMALEIVRSYVAESSVGQRIKETLNEVIFNGMGDNLIELLVEASRGELNINQLQEQAAEQVTEEIAVVVHNTITKRVCRWLSNVLGRTTHTSVQTSASQQSQQQSQQQQQQ